MLNSELHLEYETTKISGGKIKNKTWYKYCEQSPWRERHPGISVISSPSGMNFSQMCHARKPLLFLKKLNIFLLIHQIFETTTHKAFFRAWKYMVEIILIDFTWREKNNRKPNACLPSFYNLNYDGEIQNAMTTLNKHPA